MTDYAAKWMELRQLEEKLERIKTELPKARGMRREDLLAGFHKTRRKIHKVQRLLGRPL